VPPCTACFCVSIDIFPYLYISKQSLSLLTEFSYRCVCLSSTEVLYSRQCSYPPFYSEQF